MIVLIILVVLTAIGGYLLKSDDYDALGILMVLIFGFSLLFHIIFISIPGYQYGVFLAEREAFEETLRVSREYGNKHETAAIVADVAKWNSDLANYKYTNSVFLFDAYVDDRIEGLDPIK